MQLHTLPKITDKKAKRLGRGHGSGRSKTAGRGTKGQKARRDIPLFFEGGALPLIKRLPFLRGKGRNKRFYSGPVILNLKDLGTFPINSVVDQEFLVKNKLVNAQEVEACGVKILGDGEITVSITVKLPTSKSARAKIEKAGGSVVA